MISDTHSFHLGEFHVPDGDLLLHAGDFTMMGELSEVQLLEEKRAQLLGS